MEMKEQPLKDIRKKTNLHENIGKVLINLGQIVFGTLFLGGVLRGEVPHYIMITIGIIGAVLLLSLGVVLSSKEQKDKEE